MKPNKKLVYISHPFGNNMKNVEDIESIIHKLYSSELLYKNYCFVSPVHAFGFMYNTVKSYDIGLSYCTDLLEHCNIMLMFDDWESSRGCKGEKGMCDKLKIPYIIFKDSSCLDKLTEEDLYGMIEAHLK